MNYQHLKTAGRLLRKAQMHRINAAFTPADFIRVTYTHQVLKEFETNFEALVDFIRRSYSVITPAEFFKLFHSRQPLAGRFALLTFDDGLLSSYRAIKAISSRFGIKVIMFVPTQILELKTALDMKTFAWERLNFQTGGPPAKFREEEYLTMSREQILDLHRDGHAIFPHTHTHRRLNDIMDEETANFELARPKEILQELLQTPMDAFAFPVGTERVVSDFAYCHVRKHYQYCFTALAGKNTPATNAHFIHRDCMNADYDLKHVRNILEGVFDPYYQWKLTQLRIKTRHHGS